MKTWPISFPSPEKYSARDLGHEGNEANEDNEGKEGNDWQ